MSCARRFAPRFPVAGTIAASVFARLSESCPGPRGGRAAAWLAALVGLAAWSLPVSAAVRVAAPDVERLLAAVPELPEAILLLDATDGRLDRLTLIEAALAAEGWLGAGRPAESIARWEAWARSLVDRLGQADHRRQAREALAALHAHWFQGGYEESAGLVDALSEGRFNCLGATILYLDLARRLGFAAEAVVRPGHVVARLRLEGRACDVETTSPSAWNHVDARSAPAETAGPALAGSPAWPDEPRTLGDVELVALCYYNRATRHLAHGCYPAAVAAGARALGLDPGNVPARANLLVALNRWALSRADEGQLDEALALLGLARRLEPRHPALARNEALVGLRRADGWLGQGRTAEAAALLARLEPSPSDAPLWARYVQLCRQAQDASQQVLHAP